MRRKKSPFEGVETADQLAAALQANAGTLTIAQMKAARLIAKLRGWNLNAPDEPVEAAPSSDVPISEPVGWYWISSSVKHGPLTEEEFNNDMERIERETLALNRPSPCVDEEHPDGLLHGAVSIITPSGREWVVGCRRRTSSELAYLNKDFVNG